MITTRFLIVSGCLLAVVSLVAASDKELELSTAVADAILKDEPLTIVFRQINESPRFGDPYDWCWSINSAGQVERTGKTWIKLQPLTPVKSTRQQAELSAKQMAAIRTALREERFFHLKGEYGPVVIHGGWCTLTLIAGDHVKQVRYCSSWGWTSQWEREKMAEAAPAVRVWLKICEAVDPDGKVFTERQGVAKALAELKK